MKEFDPLGTFTTYLYSSRLRHTLRLSFSRFALFFSSVFFGVTFLSGILFGFFYWQIANLRDVVLKEFEQTIGFSFAYDSIDPHFLSRFKIHNVRLFDPDLPESDQTLLSFSSLELTLDIWALLGFSSEFLIQRVALQDLVIHMDLENPSAREKMERLIQLLNLEDERAWKGSFFTSLQNRRNFRLYANNIQVNLQLPDVGEMTFSTDNISLILVNGRWDLTGLLSLALENTPILALQGLNARFYLKGFGKLNPWQAQLLVSVQGLRGNNFQIVDHGYFLSMNENYLRILNTTGENFNLDILYEFEPHELKGSFVANEWQLLNVLNVREEDSASLSDLLTYRLNAHGAVQYVNSELSYSLQARTHLDKRFPEILQGALFLNLKGNESWLRVEDLTFKNQSGGELSYVGDFSFVDLFPRGELSFSKFVWGDSQSLSGTLSFREAAEGYQVQSKDLSWGTFPIKAADISFQNVAGALVFRGFVAFPQTQFSQLSFEGSYPFSNQLNLSLSMTQFPLDQLHLVLSDSMRSEGDALEVLTKGLSSNAALEVTFDLTKIQNSVIHLAEFSAQSARKPSQGIFLKVAGSAGQIQVNRLDFLGKDFFVKTQGLIRLYSHRPWEVGLEVNINGQRVLPLDLLWNREEKTVELISGEDLGFFFNYRAGVQGLLSMTNFVLPLGETLVTLDQRLVLRAGEGQAWLVDWERSDVRVEGSPVVPTWSMNWQALMTRDVLTVENVSIEDSFSRFVGGGVVQDWLTTSRGMLFLTSEGTQESLQLLWSRLENSFSLEFTGAGLWTEHFQNPPLPVEDGLVDLGISVLWADEEKPVVSGNLKLKNAYWGESPFKVESAFAFLANNVISSNTWFQIADRAFFLDDVRINLTDQEYVFKGYLEQENPRNLRIKRLSRWQGNGIWGTGAKGGDMDFKLSFMIDQIQQKNLKDKVLNFTLTKEGGLFTLNSRDKTSLHGLFNQETGRLSLFASDPYPIQVRVEGFILPDLLDLRMEGLQVQIANLPLSILVEDAFGWQEGLVTGNLFLSGIPSRPNFNGTLVVSAARVSTPYVGGLNLDGTPNEEEIGPFNAKGFFQGNLIYLVGSGAIWNGSSSIDTLPAIEVQIDRDKAAVKGLFAMDGWELERFQLWVETLTSRRGIPVAYNQTGVKARGYALGSFQLQLEDESLDLKGDLTLNQVDMSLSEEKPATSSRRNQSEILVTAQFDLNLGRSVHFLWPNEILPLFRAISDINQKLKLTFDGTNNDFALVGEVGIRGGTLTYYSSSFVLTKGRIIFNEDQNNFNPYIEAQAETRIIDTSSESTSAFSNRTGQSLRVILSVNSLLSEMIENATLFSSPSRSQDELRILLGIGDISFDKIEKAQDLGEAGLNLASGLVTSVIFKPIEDFFRNTLNLDYFSLNSDWLKRLSTMWVSSASGQSFPIETIGSDPTPVLDDTVSTNKKTALDTLAEVLDNTRLSAGRYITNGVFFESGFTLSRGKETYEGRPIRATIDVGFELNASPLVVGWQAGLDLANLSNFDSFSNQISIGWSFSY